MNRNWLLYLVIFSMALNVGTIGAFAYLRWQDRQGQEVSRPEIPPPPDHPARPGERPLPFRELLGKLNLDEQQRQTLWRLAPEHRRQVREMRRELAEKRGALFALLKQAELPAWEPVREKIREINDMQLRLEEEMIRHLLEVQKNLRPEQRQVLLGHLEQRLSHFWRGRGQSCEPMGPRRGPGPPPGAPCPPEPSGAK